MELREFFSGCSALFLSKKDRKTKLEYIFALYDTNNGKISLYFNKTIIKLNYN